jgi:hypothetical protein
MVRPKRQRVPVRRLTPTIRHASEFGTPRAINRTNCSRFSTCGAGPGDRCAIACSILLRRCDVR